MRSNILRIHRIIRRHTSSGRCGSSDIQFLKTLQKELIVLEELEDIEKEYLNVMADLNDLNVLLDQPIAELSTFQEVLREFVNWFSLRVREVLHVKTNTRSLLELSTSAVFSHRLPTNELPKELELHLQRYLTQTQSSKLDEEVVFLFREAAWNKILWLLLNVFF